MPRAIVFHVTAITWIAALLACALLASCGDRAPDARSQPDGSSNGTGKSPSQVVGDMAKRPAPSPELEEKATALFAKQCATCHGPKGRGDGPAAYLLYPKPRDFGEAKFRLVSTDNQVPTDEDLFRTITRGIPRSVMPDWEHLLTEDRWALVYYVRGLAREGFVQILLDEAEKNDEEISREEALEIANSRTTAGKVWQIPPETPRTLEALVRGRRIFIQNCAQCHGADGRGTGREDLVDNKGVPIRPRNFTRGIFKGGKSGEDLANRIPAGIPGTPMPSHASVFKMDGKGDKPRTEALWALVHYVQSLIRPEAQELAVQCQKQLTVRRITTVPEDPTNPIWKSAPPTYLALMHLWWNDDRPDGVLVRLIHDSQRIGMHMTWEDRTINDHVLRQEAFSDAAAIQFSSSLDPPLFTMGSKESPVNIWQWKAHWQKDLLKHGDVELTHPNMAVDTYPSLIDRPLGEHTSVGQFATGKHSSVYLTGWGAGNLGSTPGRKSAVESLVASGFGTLTSRPADSQAVRGKGMWKDGFWEVVMIRDLNVSHEGAIALVPGTKVSVAFAIWDGEAKDRNGQKSVTVWHRLILE